MNETRTRLDPTLGLPRITEGIPGLGGQIRQAIDDFVVMEEPLYEPAGEGEHIYLRITRRNQTTRDLVLDLGRLLGLKDSAIGVAGQKDRAARTTQTISLHMPKADVDDVCRRVQDELDVSIESAARHLNKLRMGHLASNRFVITVRNLQDESSDRLRQRLEAKLEAIRERGMPNYFGPQRFGRDGDNAERGRRVLEGRERAKGWLRRLLISAFQSELFNGWLAARIRDGLFDSLMEGDLASPRGSHGVFTTEEVEREQARCAAGEIDVTGPLFGKKMARATGPAGDREKAILREAGITEALFEDRDCDGGRRAARVFPKDLRYEFTGEILELDFSLPPGSFATAFLREIQGPMANL